MSEIPQSGGVAGETGAGVSARFRRRGRNTSAALPVCRRLWVRSRVCDGLGRQPHGDVASSDQGAVVRGPVLDCGTSSCTWDGLSTSFHQFHRSSSGSNQSQSLNLSQHRIHVPTPQKGVTHVIVLESINDIGLALGVGAWIGTGPQRSQPNPPFSDQYCTTLACQARSSD